MASVTAPMLVAPARGDCDPRGEEDLRTMTAHRRNLLARALAVLAALALVLAVAASYIRSTVVDSNQFADRATVALHNPAVRSLIADTVTNDLVLHQAPNLVAAKPLIEGVVSSVVASNAFAGLFRAGVRDVHRAVLHHDRNTVTLTVADVGTLAAAGLEALKPKLAGEVRSTRLVRLFRDNVGTIPAKAMRIAGLDRVIYRRCIAPAKIIGMAHQA